MAYEHSFEDKRVQRIARNTKVFVGGLMKTMREYMEEAVPLRHEILADVTALTTDLPSHEVDSLLSAIAQECQALFDAEGSPKVDTERKCLGRDGGGITASEGGITVKGCVIGTVDTGPQGGGVEVEVAY